MHLSLCCAYEQRYPYTLHFYICSSMPISWSTFRQTLIYSTKCNTVTLHLPICFVKYAVHGRQLDELLLFLALAQQPDNGSWTLDMRYVMFHGKKSVPCPTPNMEHQVPIFITQRAEYPSYTPRHWKVLDLRSVTSCTHNKCGPLMRSNELPSSNLCHG